MDLAGWETRYRSSDRLGEDAEAAPTPLLLRALADRKPGRALDLGCGTGRNAIWLAKRGWTVTAVDGAPAAIESLQRRTAGLNLGDSLKTQVSDLRAGSYSIQPASWNLIVFLFYLPLDLFPLIQNGVRPGGLVIGIVHITYPGEDPTENRFGPGELAGKFAYWEILHNYEGASNDPAHKRAVAEIVAQRPAQLKLGLRNAIMVEPLELTPQDLEARLKNGEALTVIDVREPDEFAIARLADSQLIPMQSIPQELQRLEMLSDEKPLAILCHHGFRSLNVAVWLRQHGVANCFSVTGGIDRWSREIDPAIPRY